MGEETSVDDEVLKRKLIPPNERMFWNTRRKMAWICLWSMVLEIPIILILAAWVNIDVEVIKSLSVLIGGSYTAFTAVLLTYVSGETYMDSIRAKLK